MVISRWSPPPPAAGVRVFFVARIVALGSGRGAIVIDAAIPPPDENEGCEEIMDISRWSPKPPAAGVQVFFIAGIAALGSGRGGIVIDAAIPPPDEVEGCEIIVISRWSPPTPAAGVRVFFVAGIAALGSGRGGIVIEAAMPPPDEVEGCEKTIDISRWSPAPPVEGPGRGL
jgi:hypothetical protein